MIFQIGLVCRSTLVGPSVDRSCLAPDVDPPGVAPLTVEHHPPRRPHDDDGWHQAPRMGPRRPTEQVGLHAAAPFTRLGYSNSFKTQETSSRLTSWRSAADSPAPFHTSTRMLARTYFRSMVDFSISL